MTEMIPPSVASDTVSGEKKVFNALQNAKDTDNWIGLHSLDIFGDVNQGQAESDFVILIPGHGLLVVEVKSHEKVAHQDGVWYLNGVAQKRGPVKQASNNMHAIMKELWNQNINTKSVPIGFAVWFPNAPRIEIPASPEWRPWTFLFAEDTDLKISTKLKKILKMTREGLEKQMGRLPEPVSSAENLRAISKSLRPDFISSKSFEQRKNDVLVSIEKATNVQKNLLNQLETNAGEVLIKGLAGTGKSFLATTDAKRSHQQGDRTLYLCYNKHLAKKLEEELSPYKLVSVRTVHSAMLEASGLEKAPERASKDWWSSELPELASEGIINGRFEGGFDHVVIDEGQDLGLQTYLDFIDLSRYKGETGGKLTVYGDFDNQGIYLDGNEAEQLYFKNFPNMKKLLTLDMNCRNTREVGSTVQELCGNRFEFSDFLRADQGPFPNLSKYKDESELRTKLAQRLSALVRNYGEEEVILLSSERIRLQNLLEEMQISAREMGSPVSSGIRYSTTYGFKGLEAMAIVLVEFEDSTKASQDTFYVAGTRSLSSFDCYIPERLTKQLFQTKEPS